MNGIRQKEAAAKYQQMASKQRWKWGMLDDSGMEQTEQVGQVYANDSDRRTEAN